MTEPRQDTPNDPQLSRLYREQAQDEPSAAMDQRILAAARQAVAPQTPDTRRNGWWQRWRLPLSLATTVMLTVSLALLVERQPQERAENTPHHTPQRAADQATNAASPASKAESMPPAAAGIASEISAKGEMRALPAAAPAPALSATRQATESPTESLAKSRADSTRPPEVWLEEIRALRRAGNTEEAGRQLREFRLAHPDFPLPEEFRQ